MDALPEPCANPAPGGAARRQIVKRLIVNTNNCGVLDDWAERQGIRYSWKTDPRPGDLVMFDFKGNHTKRDHVGIVVSASGDTVSTVEGNTSVTSNDNGGAVMRRTRTRSQITSFIRPRYNARQTAARLLEIAQSQVGVKESPAGSNNVKYNTWYYGHAVSGDAYPWCCVFVEWCFAVLADEISIVIPEEKKVTITVKELEEGSTGEEVKTVQRLLKIMGYKGADGKALGIDGDFGQNTLYAVRSFQKKKGLSVDGIVGVKTWGQLIG